MTMPEKKNYTFKFNKEKQGAWMLLVYNNTLKLLELQ